MAVRQLPDGKWLVDVHPSRSAPRIKRRRKTKAEALRLERQLLARYENGQELSPKKDTRNFSDLIELYYDLHGQHLTCKKRMGTLRILCELSGDPDAEKLTPEWYLSLKSKRAKVVTPSTLNHDRAYLHSLFQELIRAGQWHKDNPISTTRPVKYAAQEMTFLSREQINVLLAALKESKSEHVHLVASICLSTGARWSEAETLTRQQVQNDIISFWKTKSGKPRHVPVSPDLAKRIQSHRSHSVNRLFGGCYKAFTHALEKTGIKLPPGQRTHVLRHTFASWFVINGGSLLDLQKILGHSTITMTMRYAHLAPGHLHSARVYNPLAWEQCGNSEKEGEDSTLEN